MSRKKRRANLKHYHQNEAGGYEYDGAHWRWQDDSLRKPFIRAGYLRICLAIGLMILAGCIPAPGAGYAVSILLPYAAGILAGVLSLMAFVRMGLEKDRLRDYVYEASVPKLPGRLTVSMAGAAVAGAAQLIHIAVYRPHQGLVWAIVYAACELLAAGLLLIQKKKGDLLTWTKE